MTANWMAPVVDAWESVYGKGTCPAAMVGKHLKPLAAHYDGDTIAEHLAVYLSRTEAQYLSLPRFAMTFLSWKPRPLVDEDGVLLDDR